jgi:uncharacterized SAM-dependent methyltransferase
MREDLYQLYLELKTTEDNIEFLNKFNCLSRQQYEDLESRYPEIFDRAHNLMTQEIYRAHFGKKNAEKKKQAVIDHALDVARRLSTPEKILKEIEDLKKYNDGEVQKALESGDEEKAQWFKQMGDKDLKFLTEQLKRSRKGN